MHFISKGEGRETYLAIVSSANSNKSNMSLFGDVDTGERTEQWQRFPPTSAADSKEAKTRKQAVE